LWINRNEKQKIWQRDSRSYVHALKAAGLLDSNDGAFSKRMHRFGEQHDFGRHIDEQRGLEEGTVQEKAAAEQGSETTTSNNFSALSDLPRTMRLRHT
jgi:hypothetical protein